MRMISSMMAAAIMVAALDPCGAKEPDYDFGPVPAWSDYQAQAEAAVLSRLRDPDSAKFRWPWGMGKIYKKGLLSTLAGYASCGYVNAKNAYGGFTGETAFSVLIDHGRVVDVSIDSQPGGYIEQQCLVAASRPGGLQRRESSSEDQDRKPQNLARSAEAIEGSARFGFHFTQSADGARISSLATDSAAAKAGIKPGMVIERVNGLSVTGADIGLIKQMLESAVGSVRLSMTDGSTYILDGDVK